MSDLGPTQLKNIAEPIRVYSLQVGVPAQTKAAAPIAEFGRALALNPNLAIARASVGLAKLFDGRAEETEGHENEALRLSPRDQRAWVWMTLLGNAKMQLGIIEDAVKWYRRGIELNFNFPLMRFRLAAALV